MKKTILLLLSLFFVQACTDQFEYSETNHFKSTYKESLALGDLHNSGLDYIENKIISSFDSSSSVEKNIYDLTDEFLEKSGLNITQSHDDSVKMFLFGRAKNDLIHIDFHNNSNNVLNFFHEMKNLI